MKVINKLLIYLIIASGIFLFNAQLINAQDFGEITGLNEAAGEEGADYDTSKIDLIETIGTIVRYILSLLGVIMLCIVVIAFFIMNSAGGDDEQVNKSKNWIKRGIIGMLIIMAAYFLTIGFVDFFAGKPDVKIFDRDFQE